jgi:Protein of unknown function (DUF3592)
MGFFADLYLVYLFKVLVRGVKFYGNQHWPSVEGIVTATPNSSMAGWGCPTVEIPYKYRVNGELYTGLHEEPFLLSDSRTEYAARFRAGSKLLIRVKPDNPQVSMMREN